MEKQPSDEPDSRGCQNSTAIVENHPAPPSYEPKIGFRKRGLLETGSFQKCPFSRDSREFKDVEILEIPQSVESKRDSDHFLEIL